MELVEIGQVTAGEGAVEFAQFTKALLFLALVIVLLLAWG